MSKLLVIIKPWSIQHADKIITELDHQGHRLQTAKVEKVRLETMAKHYEVHQGRSNYQDMIHDFENLSVILAVYEGDFAKFNDLKDIIRKRFASDIPPHKTHLRNALHMSGDEKEFEREYNVWKGYLKNDNNYIKLTEENRKIGNGIGLESRIAETKNSSVKKIALVDTAGNISYSLIAGIILDYCAGLNLAGIITSRASATAINAVTGGPYGWWREKAFTLTKTTKKSSRIKKTLADLIAFNIVQVPIYATGVVVGSLISEGNVDWNKVGRGVTYLAAISPLIGPTLGLYMDGLRKLFGVKSAAEGAYTKNKSQ